MRTPLSPLQRAATVLTPHLKRALIHLGDQGGVALCTRTYGPGTIPGLTANRLHDLGMCRPVGKLGVPGRHKVRITEKGQRTYEALMALGRDKEAAPGER